MKLKLSFSKSYLLLLSFLTIFLILNYINSGEAGLFGLQEQISFTEESSEEIYYKKYQSQTILKQNNLESILLNLSFAKKTDESFLEITNFSAQEKKTYPILFEQRSPNSNSWLIELPSFPKDTKLKFQLHLNSGNLISSSLIYNYSKLNDLPYFVAEKYHQLSKDKEFRNNLIVFILPLLAYLIGMAVLDGYEVQTLTILTISFIDIFLLKDQYPYISTGMFLLWLPVLILSKIESAVSLFLCIVYLGLATIFHISHLWSFSDRSTSWAYIFFLSAVFIKTGELLGYFKAAVSISQFLSRVFDITRYRFSPNQWLYVPISQMLPNSLEASYILLRTKSIIDKIFIGIYYLPIVGSIIFFLHYSLKTINDGVRIYQRFNGENYHSMFILKTGIPLLILYVGLTLVITQIPKQVTRLILTIFTLTFLAYLLTPVIVDITTPFKDKVVISKISPNETSEPWVDINVEGLNFKEYPFVGRIEVSGVDHRIIKWSDNLVIFRTNPQQTRSGNIKLWTLDGKESNEVGFMYWGNR